ncbi:MAG: sulfite exporter TauE/SafE family protein, partial [Sphingomonadales bacterium]
MELYIILIMLGSGTLAGFLAGLMGIGGGIVTVPILFYVLGVYGIEPGIQMHMAIATSLAIIIPTSLFSAKTHYKGGFIDLSLIKSWSPFIVLGAIIGGIGASFFSGEFLKYFFSVMAFIMGLRLISGLEGRKLLLSPLGFIGK